MNIYFACSITGGRAYESIYQAITRALLADGHQVPTAHLAESGVVEVEIAISPREVYRRDVEWICACNALVAEVSVPSHGVGYEVGYALDLGKPVLCLYQVGQRVSKMITGNPDPRLHLSQYTESDQAVNLVREFLKELGL